MLMPKKVTKKTRGRQRIEMKRLDGSKKQVTFSKRRAGLFKKAAELCVLCGAEVAIISFNDKCKVYGFGHPDVGTVVNRYLNGHTFAEPCKKYVPVNEFNRQYAEAQMELEMEKNRIAEIEEAKEEEERNELGFWWDEPLGENMGLEELQQYMCALQEVRRKVAARADEMMMVRSSLMSAMEMGVGVGNNLGLENNFVDQNWEGGNGVIFGTHRFGFAQGKF